MSQPTMQEMLSSAKKIDDNLKGVSQQPEKPVKKTKAKTNAKSKEETK